MTGGEILTVAEVASEPRCSKAHVYNAIAGDVVSVSPLPAMGRRKLARQGAAAHRENDRPTCSGDRVQFTASDKTNSRLAYVAISRARYDAQIYTNDAANLGIVLSREVSHAAAVEDWKHETGIRLENHSNQEKNHGNYHAVSHGLGMGVE